MKKKILIIEDEPMLGDLLYAVLKEEGFEVEKATTGEEGIKKIKEFYPDLILLDILLPFISGYDVLSFLKKEEKFSSIPVIVLSNLGQDEEIKKSLALGAKEHIIKSNFTLEEIVEKVKKIFTSPEK
jgi:DNA-binding response OmpR family regulator